MSRSQKKCAHPHQCRVGRLAVTIAACFLSGEGIVLGADSTVTLPSRKEARYFNNEQKVFEIGTTGSLGLTLWAPHRLRCRTAQSWPRLRISS